MTISRAYRQARDELQEYLTVDHLTLALLDTGDVSQGLRACEVDVEHLRRALSESIEVSTTKLRPDNAVDTQPTLQFQRVMQRAVYHAQSGRAKEVTAAGVMTAIFREADSHTVTYLTQQGVSRSDWLDRVDEKGLDPSGEPAVQPAAASDSGAYLASSVSSSIDRVAVLEERVQSLEKRLGELEKKLQQ